METINIYLPNTTIWKTIKISADCYYRNEIEGDECIELKWENYDYEKIPVGSYVEYDNRQFRLTEPHEPSRRQENIFCFNPIFYAEPYHWHKAMACLYEGSVTANITTTSVSVNVGGITSRELDWSFKGTLPDALSMLLQAIKVETGATWIVNFAFELKDKLIEITAQGLSIYDMLSQIAEQCGKEFWFDYSESTPKIHISTLDVEATGTHTQNGYVLLNVGDDVNNPQVQSEAEEYFTRFYFFGSTRNIQQPESITKSSVVNRRLTLNPTAYGTMNVYPQGFIDINRTANSYQNRVYTPTLPQYQIFSKSVFFEDIYPHASYKVKAVQKRYIAVTSQDTGKETGELMPIYYVALYDSNDTSKSAITFNDWVGEKAAGQGQMCAGLVPSIAMRSGYLQGLEYEVNYRRSGEEFNDASTGRKITLSYNCFEIIFDQNSNPRLPNDTICPRVDDECTLFNIVMPESYIRNAQIELEAKAIEYIEEMAKDKSTYQLNANPIRFNQFSVLQTLTIGYRAKMIYPNGESVLSRVISIERHLDIPCDCKLTLGYKANQGTLKTLRQIVADTSGNVETIVKTTELTKNKIVSLKNGYMAQREMLEDMIFDTDGYFDTEKIRPASIETQMLSVGTRSQQFALTGVVFTIPRFASGSGVVSWTAGKLSHYTIDADNIKEWSLSAGSQTLANNNAFYIYAKCARSGTSASVSVEQTQRKFDSDTSGQWWYFLIGIISSTSSAVSGYYSRQINTTYGTTSITGRQISTGRIQSADGNTYFDLDTGTITGNITFNAAQGSDNYNTIQSLINGNSKVNTALTNASNAVSTANGASSTASSALSTANSASSTASSALSTANNANTNATNALNSINNLEIGGRNFLRNSAEMKVLSSGKAAWRASGGTLTHVTISNKPLNALTGAVRCANNGSTINSLGMAQDYVNDTDRFKFNVGENYIQSYWVRGHLSFFDNLPSSIDITSVTYTYDEYSDTYLLTSQTSGDVNVQIWLQNAFREVNYLYLAGKSVRISVDITSSNTNNKPRFYLYDNSAGTLAYKDLSQGHNEWTITFPTIASGSIIGLILRMHQNNLGGTVAVGDTCKFANLRIVLADNSQYNYPQPIWGSNASYLTSGLKIYPTHEWQKVVFSGELTGTQLDAYSAGYTYCTKMPVGGWFEVCAMKLEKGTKATDWTPAPEDVEAEILAEKTRLDNIDSDSVFSIAEKQVFRNEWFTISGIANTSTAGATIVANSAYKNGSLYQSYNSCPHATTLRTELLTAFNNLRTYLNTCGLYTHADYTSFNKATLQNYLATYYTAELNLQKYKENVGNLVATCSTAAGTSPKVIICPELTADMLVDPDMRMKIKFTNANSLSQFTMRFQNSSGGSPIVPTGMISDNYRVYIHFNGAEMNYVSHSSLLYWVADMEIEWKYYGTFIAYGNQYSSVLFQMVDEANYKTIMTYSKAIQGSTSIIGGLILTQMIQAGAGSEQAGMNGTSTSNVAFWAGGSVGNADNFNVPVVIKRDGNAKMGLLMIGNDGKLYFKDSGSERFLITNDNVALNSGAKIYNTGNENGNDSYETFGTAIASGTSVTTTRTNYEIKSISNIPNASSGVKYNNVTIKVHAEMGMVASTAGTGGYATIGLEIYDGSSWIKVTSFTKAFRTGETGEWAYPTSNDYIFIYNSATLSSNKAVIGLRAFAYCDSVAGSVTCGITNVKWCYYQDLTKSKTIIGKNGLGVMLNSTNLFQCTHANDTVLTTTIKGNTDIPGVLWAGKISKDGTTTTTTTTKSNAGRSVTCSLSDTSLYTLTLNGFSSAPTPIATVEFPSGDTANGWSANIVSVTQTQIKIRIRKDNSNKAAPFHLVLFGSN